MAAKGDLTQGKVGEILGLGRVGLYRWTVDTTPRPMHIIALGKSLEEAKAVAEEEIETSLGTGEAAHARTRLEGPPEQIVYEFGGLVLR
jgi:hypothetical protein